MENIKDLSQKDLNKIKNKGNLDVKNLMPVVITSLSGICGVEFFAYTQGSEIINGADTFIWDDLGVLSVGLGTLTVAHILMRKYSNKKTIKEIYYKYNQLFSIKKEGKLEVMNTNEIIKKALDENYLVNEFIENNYNELKTNNNEDFFLKYVSYVKDKLEVDDSVEISDDDYYRILGKKGIYLGKYEVLDLVYELNNYLNKKFKEKESLNKLEVTLYGR